MASALLLALAGRAGLRLSLSPMAVPLQWHATGSASPLPESSLPVPVRHAGHWQTRTGIESDSPDCLRRTVRVGLGVLLVRGVNGTDSESDATTSRYVTRMIQVTPAGDVPVNDHPSDSKHY